jgi:flagellar assembly protein FliH
MSDRRERIPAAEVPDPKLWKLPFWTEPKHIVQAEVEAEEEDDSEVLIEEEEIEIEPITAEQLEAIRQDAYNEGLEQGLVEGRQKGEKLGFDEGNKTGITEGKEVGEKLGYGAGLQKGEKQAEADADNARAELSSKLHSCMRNMEKAVSEQKAAIEDILPGLVISIAEAVVAEELSQGSEHIVNIVQQALNALPTDTGGITIECSPHDLEFLKNAQIDSDFDAKFKSSSAIPAGGC